jgi:zinc metalloprotease ZmpB
MNQEFDHARNVYLDRDADGIGRQLSHAHAPVVIEGATVRHVVAAYLRRFGELLGLTSDQFKNLDSSPSKTIEDTGVEYRFLDEKQQFDTVAIAFSQTDFGLPVWRAGIAVHVKLNPFRVLGAQSTMHADLEVKRPSRQAAKRAESISEEEFASQLGLRNEVEDAYGWDRDCLKIEGRSLVIYRYESAKRSPPVPSGPPVESVDQGHKHALVSEVPTLPLPPLADHIREGHHYVCAKIDFALSGRLYRILHWTALIDVESLSVLYLIPYTSGVNGLVFEIDPITTNGGPGPAGTNATLNPIRVSDVLPGLVPPVAGTQSLVGDNVQLSDVEGPAIAAPTEPTGTDFNFNARTDNFAAVNAYYHCDKFFRLLDGMGFTRAGYFGGTTFPSPVDHRGSINVATGIEINAHCLGTAGGVGILQTTFALADLGDLVNPLGIACDYRVVLHELGGHGVLYNHVSSANFGFAHSAGDSVAAVLCDAGSQALDRFVTFPWVNIGRRHDRTPAAGWGWAGTIGLNPFSAAFDAFGYNNEQILSTSHFRIYQSIGGDSADLPTQRFAGRMTAYLILRAIGSLTPATNPPNAAGWVTALLAADLGDWLTENVTGGAYGKVIRWAFEKQGLFQAAGTATPNNLEGAPPAVDVYIDDGRAGLYQYQPNWWSCQSIWNRLSPDGLTGHEDPAGGTNYAYVKIKNRGTTVANGVVVKAYHCKPSAGVLWPDDLQPMSTAQLSVGTLQPNNTEEKIVGPFEWTPTTNAFSRDTMMMIVSAAGDPSNVDNFTPGRVVEDWRLVPNDNNIGRRDVALVRLATLIVDSGNFGNVCVGSIKDEMLYLSNSGFNRVTITAVTSSSAEFLVPSVLSYPINIASGSFLEIPIRFQPVSFGPKSATITVTSNDPGGPKNVMVSGDARSPRLAVVTADSGNFGNACVGSFADESVILSNSGHCTLSVLSLTSSSGEFLIPNVLSYPLTIAAGGSLDIPIRFQPTSFGAKSAILTVVSDDPAGPRTIPMSGFAPSGKLAVTGSTSFGGVTACCCADRTLSVCNTGACALHVTGVRFKRKSSHWALLNNPFPATLYAGSCLNVVIRYKATEKCARSCELIIESDDPNTPVRALELLAYTIWDGCGCKDCCEGCRKGGCEKSHSEACCRQGYPCCCDDDEDDEQG